MMRLVAYNSFQIHLFGFKESYGTNHIVSALPDLCGILTNVLAWILCVPRQLQSRYRTEHYWCCGHCQTLEGLRTLEGFKTFGKTAFAALNSRYFSSPRL